MKKLLFVLIMFVVACSTSAQDRVFNEFNKRAHQVEQVQNNLNRLSRAVGMDAHSGKIYKEADYRQGITWETRYRQVTSVYTVDLWIEVYDFFVQIFRRENGVWVLTQTINRQAPYPWTVVAENVYCNSVYSNARVSVSNGDFLTISFLYPDSNRTIRSFSVKNDYNRPFYPSPKTRTRTATKNWW